MSDKKLVTGNPFGGDRPSVPRRSKPVEEEPKPVEPTPAVKEDGSPDLLAGLTDKKADTKSYSFYLDSDVVARLDRLAKKTKTSRSKVLNTILKNYLSE